MNFLDEIAKLQQDISKYLTIHNNPHDTSKHESFAKKLTDVIPTLEKAAPTPPKKTITHSVGKNATNDYNDVKLVQGLLGIKADGHSGPNTNLAIRKFQHSLGFKKADGRIDPGGVTWKNLSKKIAPAPEETPTDTNNDTPSETEAREIKASVGHKGANNLDDVLLVQKLLGLDTDGKVGRGTIRAIAQFQQSLGTKKPDGRIDPNGFTWKSLSKKQTPTPEETPTDTNNDTPSETEAHEIKASVGHKGANNLDDVLLVQKLLGLDTDGKVGRGTIRAIAQFQKSLGTKKPDGRIDPNGFTWKALSKKGTPTTPSKVEEAPKTTKPDTPISTSLKGSVGKGGDNHVNDVRLVQQLLKDKGASLSVDGDAGPGTIKAIKAFQESLGNAHYDGRVDPNGYTWQELNKANPNSSAHNDKMVVSTGDEPIPEELSVTSKIKKSVGAKGVNLPEDVLLVRKLLIKFNHNLKEITTSNIPLVSAIKRFQKEYAGSSKPDGRIDPNGKTWNTLLGIGRIRGGIYSIAQKYGIEPAVILAIQSVESGGNGFLADGRPKILFEGHIFWRELKKAGKDPLALQAGNENIIYKKWTKKNYKFNEKEYDRLALAIKIDKIAALKSASWGEFQIMGFNHAISGYSDVESFVKSMYKPGVNQLGSLMGFLKENRLIRHVQGDSKDWAALAKGYNGPAYAKNKYDVKLANAYARFSKIVS